MGKMFKCENGTMFAIDDVLSIEKAERYYDKEGNKISPSRIFSSEKELKDAIPSIVRKPKSYTCGDFVDDVLSLPITGPLLLLHAAHKYVCKAIPTPFEKPAEKAEREKKEEENSVKREVSSWEDYLQYGYFYDNDYKPCTVKQWEVKVKNQKEKIHIFNSDYERLCAEMGN